MIVLRKITTLVAVFAAVAGLAVITNPSSVKAADCDANAVMFCGASSASVVINKYDHGDGHNTVSSIQHIYSSFGISSSDIHAMGGSAQSGSVTSSGDVMLGNKVVATGVITAGRQDINGSCGGSRRMSSQGTTFFTRPPCVSFVSSPLSAFVVMKNGVFQFAILSSCGNPVTGHPKTLPPPATTPTPKPAPKPQPAPTPTPQPTKPTNVVSICGGNTTNSNTGIASQSGNCSSNTTLVEVQNNTVTPSTPAPFGQCTNLQVSVAQDGTRTLIASVGFQTSGGAQLQSITYDFGDGVVVPPTTQTTMSHTFQQDGTFIIIATLSFSSGGQAVAPSVCQTPVTINTTVQTVPVPPATPPVTTSAPVVTEAAASPVTKLVNTGAGNVVAVFAGTAVIGTLGYRYFLRRHLSAH